MHPAVDIAESSTRNLDALVDSGQAEATARLRRTLLEGASASTSAIEGLLERLAKDASNDAILKKA